MTKRPPRCSLLKDSQPAVRRYLESAGFVQYASGAQFAEDATRRGGEAAARLLAALADRSEDRCGDAEFYPLKNSSLPLSLAATFWSKGGFCVAFLDWVARQAWGPVSRILDVGCDNGLLSCFFARHFPAARVVGIDRCAAGIDRARELAAQLGLENVTFEVLDLAAVEVLGPASFDLVLGTHVFRTSLDLDQAGAASSMAEVEELPIKSDHLAAAGSLRRLAAPGGLLVSTDALDDPALGFWTRLLSEAGWSIDWSRSAFVYWTEPGGDRVVRPLVVAENRSSAVSWTARDALAFCCCPQLADEAGGRCYTASAAEALFEALHPKTLVRATRTRSPQGDLAHRQLWVAGALAFTYLYQNAGDGKQLQLFPATSVPELLRQMDQCDGPVPPEAPSRCDAHQAGGR